MIRSTTLILLISGLLIASTSCTSSGNTEQSESSVSPELSSDAPEVDAQIDLCERALKAAQEKVDSEEWKVKSIWPNDRVNDRVQCSTSSRYSTDVGHELQTYAQFSVELRPHLYWKKEAESAGEDQRDACDIESTTISTPDEEVAGEEASHADVPYCTWSAPSGDNTSTIDMSAHVQRQTIITVTALQNYEVSTDQESSVDAVSNGTALRQAMTESLIEQFKES